MGIKLVFDKILWGMPVGWFGWSAKGNSQATICRGKWICEIEK